MDEYISRETLLKAVEKMDRLDEETKTKYEYDKEGYILLIQNAPASDVVEVVRCKDCKYYIANYCTRDIKGRTNMFYMGENDFCSYGERKGEDDVKRNA